MFKEMNYEEMLETDGGLVLTVGVIGGGITLITAFITYLCLSD